MARYSAAVSDGKRTIYMKDEEFDSAQEFIDDLIVRGYEVDPEKVKESDLFEYILAESDCGRIYWYLEFPDDEVKEAYRTRKKDGEWSDGDVWDWASWLYDGDWRSDDLEEIAEEYRVTDELAERVCVALAEMEKEEKV